MSILLSNLLIGSLPDALGLLLFGAMMILTSMVLRKILVNDNMENEEVVVKEVV